MIILEHPPNYLPERAYIAQVILGEFLGIEYRLLKADRRDWAIYVQDFPHKVAHFEDVLFQTPQHHWLQPESLPVLPGTEPKLPIQSASPPCVSGSSQSHSGRLSGLPGSLSERPRKIPGHPRKIPGHPRKIPGHFLRLPERLTTDTDSLSDVPIVYGQPLENGDYFSETPGVMRFGLDLFGSAFFLLTRYEEVALGVRDEHERFPAAASFAWRAGLLDRPVVNEYLELLWSVLRWLAPNLQRLERHYRCLPTHDVDWLRTTDLAGWGRVLRAALGDGVKRRDAGLAIRRVRAYQQHRSGQTDPANDPYDTFDFLMSESEKRNLRSAFYFIAGHTGGDIDGVYEMDDVRVRRLLKSAHERGHEIGLHPSYHTFRDPAQIQQEFERLRLACEAEGIRQERWGGRQHYLRWENPTTWRHWETAVLHYDSTLGYAEEVGFRCGTCYEYPVYDLLARRPLALRERPLIVMEVALFDRLKLSEAQAMERIAGLVQACKRYRGDFVCLWHNSQLASRREQRFYQDVLDLAG